MDQCLTQGYNIGKNLKKLRKRANLTQAEVAARLQVMGFSVSREIYAQMEMGRHHIRIRILIGLKEIYKATYEELLEIDEEETGKIE